jgi:hypothetical protein
MGEARRRVRRGFVMREQVTLDLTKVVVGELRAELAHRQKAYPRLDLKGYVEALVESAVERERQQREAQEQAASLVMTPTAAQTAQVLSKMAPAVKR